MIDELEKEYEKCLVKTWKRMGLAVEAGWMIVGG
jgi:hypothetical protein